MLQNLFKFDSELVLIIDRTQWQNTSIYSFQLACHPVRLPILLQKFEEIKGEISALCVSLDILRF